MILKSRNEGGSDETEGRITKSKRSARQARARLPFVGDIEPDRRGFSVRQARTDGGVSDGAFPERDAAKPIGFCRRANALSCDADGNGAGVLDPKELVS